MPNLTGDPQVAAQSLYTSSTTAQHNLGERLVTSDGRVFRYAQNAGVALVAGNAIQAPAQIANHINCGVPITAIGAESVTVTPGATAGAANLYAGGYMVVSTGPGNGFAYLIDSHAAITASTAFTLKLADPIVVALTASSKVDLVSSPYKNVIQAPVTTLTNIVVGVAPFAVPASEFFWLQRGGVAPALIDGTPAVGMIVSSPGAAAGALAINSSTLQAVGVIMQTGVDVKNKPVFLTLE